MGVNWGEPSAVEAVEIVYNEIRKLSSNFGQLKSKEKKTIYTGISCIDEPLDGLLDTDLLVIGSSTGIGKTTLSTNIAINNCIAGKKVFMFALEAYDGEIEDRIKFNEIKKMYYKSDLRIPGGIKFKSWVRGAYRKSKILDFEKEVVKNYDQNVLDNLSLRYRKDSGYDVNDFERDLDAIISFKEVDIVIIDHLHYFSMEEANERIGIKNIVNKLRDLNLHYKVPIVLVAHLRKMDKYSKSLVPDEHEFHGSSEITKNATAVITLSQALDKDQPKPYLFPTYFKICKDRFDGSAKKYVFEVNFDARSGSYEEEYKLHKSNSDNTEIEELSDGKRPIWARSAKLKGYFEKNYAKKGIPPRA